MSNLFSPKAQPQPQLPETPAPQPPAPMPDAQSPQALEAARRAQLGIIGRAGRTSTILTAPDNRGSYSYSATKTGSAA